MALWVGGRKKPIRACWDLEAKFHHSCTQTYFPLYVFISLPNTRLYCFSHKIPSCTGSRGPGFPRHSGNDYFMEKVQRQQWGSLEFSQKTRKLNVLDFLKLKFSILWVLIVRHEKHKKEESRARPLLFQDIWQTCFLTIKHTSKLKICFWLIKSVFQLNVYLYHCVMFAYANFQHRNFKTRN